MSRRPSSAAAGAALFAAGCCATLAQVVVLRELLVLAAGSELAAGLSLAAWLLATGLGAALGARRRRLAEGALARLLAAVAPLVPVAVVLARLARTLLPVAPGEVVSLPLVLLGGLAAAPFCLLAGAIFPVALAASELPVAAAYGLEALGAAVGGVGFVLAAGLATQLELALGAALLPLVAALGLARSRRTALRVGLAALLVFGLWAARGRVEAVSRGWQWPGWQVRASLDSPYGNLTLARTGPATAQLDLFASGLWVCSSPDPQAAELMLLPLLAHPEPRRVLVLGLPAPLALGEILSHPQVERLDCVELDPALPRLLARLLPRAQAAPLADARLRLHIADPRQWVARAAPHGYDVILLASPEPRTAAGSRLWSRGFFRSLARLLAPGGIISFGARAAPDALGPLETDYLACLARSAEAAGRVVPLPAPGGVTFLVGRGEPPQPSVMAARLVSLGLKTRYVTPYFLRYELTPLRRAYLEAALAGSDAEPNTDLSPRCFYFNTVLWSGQHAAWLAPLYTGLAGLPAPLFAFAPLLGLAVLPFGRRRRGRAAALVALAAVGFATMGAEVALLVLFQVAHGSLYLKLALLVAAFMAGLGAGAALGALCPAGRGLAGATLLGLALLAGWLAAAGAQGLLGAPPWAFAGVEALFGVLAGYLFPALASRLMVPGEGRAPAGGLAYGAELAGSAAGSVAVSLIIVPLAGICAALWTAAAAGLAGALALAWARR